MDVVEASRQRIINIFDTAPKVYLSVSGGKDSAVLNDIVFRMAERGEIDVSKLEVGFIDEEAIFPCVEETVMDMRRQWMSLGVPFVWWCVEVRHFCCLNSLSKDESFICWDSTKRDKWVRRMQDFACTDHPKLRKRRDTYQDFLTRYHSNGCNLIGIRCSESIQRLMYMCKVKHQSKQYPIYDWLDKDIWMYLRENNVKFPDAYMYMYQVGKSKRNMRISQFFSVDTISSLVNMCEYYPGLFDKICEREPNAYLAMLYYDTEMFRRKHGSRADEDTVDYEEKTMELLNDPDRFTTPEAKKNYERLKQVAYTYSQIMKQTEWKTLYNALVAGDPKARTKRSLIAHIMENHRRSLEG